MIKWKGLSYSMHMWLIQCRLCSICNRKVQEKLAFFCVHVCVCEVKTMGGSKVGRQTQNSMRIEMRKEDKVCVAMLRISGATLPPSFPHSQPTNTE